MGLKLKSPGLVEGESCSLGALPGVGNGSAGHRCDGQSRIREEFRGAGMYSGLFLTQKHEDQGSPDHDHGLQSVCVDHGREAPWGPKERARQHERGLPLGVPAPCSATLGRPKNTRSPQPVASGLCLPRPSCSSSPPAGEAGHGHRPSGPALSVLCSAFVIHQVPSLAALLAPQGGLPSFLPTPAPI